MAAYACPEKTNCYWFCRLLLEGGKELLLQFLRESIGTITLDAYLAAPANRNRINWLCQRRPPILRQSQIDILYPPGGSDTDTQKWDITLTACILREFFYHITPQQKATLASIRELRNELYGHIGAFLMGEKEFKKSWTVTQQILQDGAKCLLNNPGSFNLQALVISIQKEEVNNVDILKDIFKSWKESDNEVLDAVQELHKNMEKLHAVQHARLDEIEKKIERNQKNQNNGYNSDKQQFTEGERSQGHHPDEQQFQGNPAGLTCGHVTHHFSSCERAESSSHVDVTSHRSKMATEAGMDPTACGGKYSFTGDEAIQQAEEFIFQYEMKSLTSFVKVKAHKKIELTVVSRLANKRIFWEEHSSRELPLTFDGVPFFVLGSQKRECCHGPDRHRSAKIKAAGLKDSRKADHEYSGRERRRLVQTTKKLDCPASIFLRSVVRFPSYKIEENADWARRKQGKQLRADLLNSDEVVGQYHVYVSLPSHDAHRNHLTDEIGSFTHNVDSKVVHKIHSLVSDGVKDVGEMKRHIKTFSKTNFPGVPELSNRFYPSNKCLRNHMYAAQSLSQYRMNNVKCMETTRMYSDSVPMFLHNRPKLFRDHCTKRLPSAIQISLSDIRVLPGQKFEVLSSDRSTSYMLDFSESLPKCACPDWKQSHLPCKHMLSVLLKVPGCGWESLSDTFTNSPHFNVDRDVCGSIHAPIMELPCTKGLDSLSSQSDLPVATTSCGNHSTQKQESVALGSRCKMLASSISSMLHLVHNASDYEPIYEDLLALHARIRRLVPKEAGLLRRPSRPGRKPYQHGLLRPRRKYRKTQMKRVKTVKTAKKKSASVIPRIVPLDSTLLFDADTVRHAEEPAPHGRKTAPDCTRSVILGKEIPPPALQFDGALSADTVRHAEEPAPHGRKTAPDCTRSVILGKEIPPPALQCDGALSADTDVKGDVIDQPTTSQAVLCTSVGQTVETVLQHILNSPAIDEPILQIGPFTITDQSMHFLNGTLSDEFAEQYLSGQSESVRLSQKDIQMERRRIQLQLLSGGVQEQERLAVTVRQTSTEDFESIGQERLLVTENQKTSRKRKDERKESAFWYERPMKSSRRTKSCVCRQKDDGRKYWNCEACDEWFHPECMGLKEEDEPDIYMCPGCRVNNNPNYDLACPNMSEVEKEILEKISMEAADPYDESLTGDLQEGHHGFIPICMDNSAVQFFC